MSKEIEQKSIHNIIAFMCDKDIEFKDLTGNNVTLLSGDFNLSDKNLRGLIIQCYKNDFVITFEKNKFYISTTI